MLKCFGILRYVLFLCNLREVGRVEDSQLEGFELLEEFRVGLIYFGCRRN